ncbi:MAG: ion transporter [Pseudomonadota bacterium]
MTVSTDITPKGLRATARRFVELPIVTQSVLGLIIFNAITLGLSTSDTVMARFGGLIDTLDNVVLTIFVLELLLKLFAYGLSFFRNAWNVFDLFVVTIGLIPQSTAFSALRALRVIRALRLLSAVPQMRAVVQALFDALPGMGAVVIMLSIVYYVFAVMATIMFGDTFDAWFGNLGRSMYTLFQIMTLEGWSDGIVRPVMVVHPYAWAFFLPFIIMTAFSVLNLFIGLLVNTMESAVATDAESEFQRLRELVRSETDQVDRHVTELQDEIRALRAEIIASRGGNNG